MKLEKLDPKTDARGTFVEAFKLPNDGQVSYLVINPGELRGNHYHTRKIEQFLVVYGSAKITCKDRDTNTVMTVEVGDQNPMIVEIHPNNTHNITSEHGCILMIWCNEQFNPEDPDTIGEEV